MWFFVALYKYLQYTEDYEFARELWPTLEDIAAWHERGTRYQIRVDADGLLAAGEPGVQLTWMDAKIGDWVVTPRMGKPVEVNALWYNALKILQHLAETFGQRADYGQRAAEVQSSFDRLFWCEERGTSATWSRPRDRIGRSAPIKFLRSRCPFRSSRASGRGGSYL